MQKVASVFAAALITLPLAGLPALCASPPLPSPPARPSRLMVRTRLQH